MKALTASYAREHLTLEEMARMEHYAGEQAVANWEAVIAEARAVMAAGDPASPAALAVARRWRDAVRQLTGGDAALARKARAAWSEALADPQVAAHVSLTPEVMNFMVKARANLPD
jgi:hypothetical protein